MLWSARGPKMVRFLLAAPAQSKCRPLVSGKSQVTPRPLSPAKVPSDLRSLAMARSPATSCTATCMPGGNKQRWRADVVHQEICRRRSFVNLGCTRTETMKPSTPHMSQARELLPCRRWRNQQLVTFPKIAKESPLSTQITPADFQDLTTGTGTLLGEVILPRENIPTSKNVERHRSRPFPTCRSHDGPPAASARGAASGGRAPAWKSKSKACHLLAVHVLMSSRYHSSSLV